MFLYQKESVLMTTNRVGKKLWPVEINFLVRVGASMDFFAALKHFIVRRRLFFQQRSTRQDWLLKEWVLRNNSNFYLVFFLHIWTILTIRRYTRSLRFDERVSG